MAELKVREFADKLIEAAGIGLSNDAKKDIRFANTIEQAQRMAVLYGIPNTVVSETAKEAGVEYTAQGVTTIGSPREGEDFSGPTSGPVNVDPSGAATATPNNGVTPAEIDAMTGDLGVDDELSALFDEIDGSQSISLLFT